MPCCSAMRRIHLSDLMLMLFPLPIDVGWNFTRNQSVNLRLAGKSSAKPVFLSLTAS
jgi:hypothetical protein